MTRFSDRGRVTRRALIGAVTALALFPIGAAWLDAARSVRQTRHAFLEPGRRVVVLGFDGVDPDLLREYLDELPALAKLAAEGSFRECRTTNPPESPVAWATFATGLLPGDHGVFDFVRRVPDSDDGYRPRNGMIERVAPKLGPLGIPLRPPRAINLRGGEGFWEPVARAGYRTSILRMPLTFPAVQARGGELLCGLGVPDLRATQGSYTLFSAGRDAWEGHTQFGGRHLKLYPREGIAQSVLEGPPDPRFEDGSRRLTVPIQFRFAGASAAVSLDGAPAVALQPGLYSRWVPVRFRAGPFVTAEGLVRFLLLEGGAQPAVYASPIQIAPHASPVPISAPADFAARMARDLGPMKTAGWPEDTFAANDGVLNDVQLFDEIRDTYRSQERLLMDRLRRADAALLAMVFTAQDRASHMYYRYRDKKHPAYDAERSATFQKSTGIADPIKESYRWMNDTVAKVQATLQPGDLLMVVSDHGFHTWRYGFNINTWLQREGYLVLADQGEGQKPRNLERFFRRQSATHHIDWDRTKLYALGLGQIYVNLQGRERQGTVEPTARAALLTEVTNKLRGLVGPDGEPVFSGFYTAEEIWQGEREAEAPDLQCAFATGYRVSWQTALLGVPPELFEPNTYAWSGDHCSNDAADTSGVLLTNWKIHVDDDPGLENIAPTICQLFSAEPPRGAKAKPLRLTPPIK